VLPVAGSNGVGDLSHEVDYARSHGFVGLSPVSGTRRFRPDLVGAILGD
jgi:hypothetical protein